MATYFSEHYATASSATVPPPTSLGGIIEMSPPGFGAANICFKRSLMDYTAATLTDADLSRVVTFESNDRILELTMSTAAAWDDATGTYTWDVGLYLSGAYHDGAEVDGDIFADALPLDPPRNRTDLFISAGDLEETDRGKMLWQLANIGDGSYSLDPQIQFDLVVKTNIASADVDDVYGTMLIECRYIPGGRS